MSNNVDGGSYPSHPMVARGEKEGTCFEDRTRRMLSEGEAKNAWIAPSGERAMSGNDSNPINQHTQSTEQTKNQSIHQSTTENQIGGMDT